MALTGFITSISPLLLGPLLLLTVLTFRTFYRLSPFHPLSHIPGPLLPKTTSFWLTQLANTGTEASTIHALHAKYGPVIRTGPNSVHIQSGSALHDIYIGSASTKTVGTGFLKPSFYRNFDIDGHVSIFSSVNHAYRAPRAKAVAGLFAPAALRKDPDVIEDCVARFCARLEREKAKGGPVDVLNVARALAIDAVTGYLFGVVYGGCDEDLLNTGAEDDNEKASQQLTASAMVNAFVAVGRFWYLPPWAFSLLDRFLNAVSPDHDANKSISQIDAFIASAVSSAAEDLSRSTDDASTTDTEPTLNRDKTKDEPKDTFQARLLSTSISPSETRAQCKDLIFAGTDSTAMTLATTIHHLSANPARLRTLSTEIHSSDPTTDPQTLPYLRAVIREGLRLSMANPVRLPRIVPSTGWTFNNHTMPAGTIIGCSPYELHFNTSTFPSPHEFRPERWLDAAHGDQLESMNRDFIPFGMGSRQCIARNLAGVELFWAVRALVGRGVLDGSSPVREQVEIWEWFNSRVVGERVEVRWG